MLNLGASPCTRHSNLYSARVFLAWVLRQLGRGLRHTSGAGRRASTGRCKRAQATCLLREGAGWESTPKSLSSVWRAASRIVRQSEQWSRCRRTSRATPGASRPSRYSQISRIVTLQFSSMAVTFGRAFLTLHLIRQTSAPISSAINGRCFREMLVLSPIGSGREARKNRESLRTSPSILGLRDDSQRIEHGE